MKRNRLNTTLVICTIAFIICLTGCKDIAGSSVAPETDMPIQSSSYLSDDSNNAIDYNQYIRKSWVMKSWNKGAYDGYCSFCIYKISNDKLEGKFYTNAISKFDDQESFMNLIGTINNDIAECMVSDEDGSNGNIKLVFKENDEIEATIQYTSKSKYSKNDSLDGTFLFRPYNLEDIDGFSPFKDQCFTLNLNSWGNVNFVSGKIIGGKHVPTVAYLTNEDGDILYSFNSLLPNNVNVKAVSFQDINMDELKDIIIILNEDNDADESPWHMVRIMTQKEDGAFYYDDKLSKELNDSGSNKNIKGVTDFIIKISQNYKSLIYKNDELGFSITFPETWKGKYTITERENGIIVFHKYSNKTAMFFEISTELESEWKEWTKTPEDEAALPVKKIGARDGLVFVYHENEQAPYMNIDDEEKKATEEYNKMLEEIRSIINSFQILD